MPQKLRSVSAFSRRCGAVLLVMGVLVQPAYAQFEMDELLGHFEGFRNYMGQFCQGAEQVGGWVNTGTEIESAISWVCALEPTLARAQSMAESLNSDVTGFFSSALGDGMNMLIDATGFELGGTDLGALMSEGINDIASGEFNMAQWMGRGLEAINTKAIEALTAAPAENASDFEKEAVNSARADPMRMDRELGAIQQRSRTLMRSAESQDLANVAQRLAASSIARGDEERMMRRVTNPNPLQGEKGTADLAQSRGKEANSSRAAIQAMVQAQADYMRQDAVSTANLVTAMKEQATQQVFTTQQLSTLAQSISGQQMEEYNKWRQDYFSELGAAMAKADQLRDRFTMAAELLGGGGED